MAVLGLCCCPSFSLAVASRNCCVCGVQASCWGAFPVELGLWVRRPQWRRLWALRAQAQQLWCTGRVAPWHVASSWTRDQTHVPCTGRQTLYHWAARGARQFVSNQWVIGSCLERIFNVHSSYGSILLFNKYLSLISSFTFPSPPFL